MGCEACGRNAATQVVVFGDGETFEVCEKCALVAIESKRGDKVG